MAKLIITNPHVDPSKKRLPSFYVFLDGNPVGNVSGPAQSLELRITPGKHTVQIRSGQLPGRSNTLTIQAECGQSISIQISEKRAIYFAIIISFLLLYYLLRVQFNVNFLAAAAIGVAVLYASIALLHPIHIQQSIPSPQ